MPTLQEVKQQANKLDGVSKFLSRKEINELPKILWENEAVENMAQGTYNNGSGLLVASNKRLLFIDKGWFSLKVEDFPYDKISSIQYETGMLSGSITIYCSGNKAAISNIIPKQKCRDFAEYIRARISKPMEHASMPTAAASSGNSVADQLEKLASLREKGVLTDEEFANEKRKILLQ